MREARERMESPELHILRESPLYETEPRDFADQPWFLNQVIEAQTEFFPRQLLSRLLRIEREMGRRREVPKGPRLIDLDILLYGDSEVHAPDLKIPHPRMTERRFVMEPLADLAPELRIAPSGDPQRRTVRQILAGLKSQSVRRL